MPTWLEGIANTIGGVAEMLWPGNWVGMPLVQEGSGQRAPIPKTGDPMKDQYPWFNYQKAGQLEPHLTPETLVDEVDLLPIIVGTIVAVFVVVRA